MFFELLHPAKAMQNHLEISSKNEFWIQNMHNSTKSRKSDVSGLAKTCLGGRVPTAPFNLPDARRRAADEGDGQGAGQGEDLTRRVHCRARPAARRHVNWIRIYFTLIDHLLQ